jgi:hypothetical protein
MEHLWGEQMTPLIYQTCQHSEANTAKCMNEGWLFCALCRKYFCEDHACIHLDAQVKRDAIRDAESVDTPGESQDIASDLDQESKSFFRELSAEQLLDKSEIELRSYFRRLMQEVKRVSREIERRMIYATELSGGPAYRRRAQMAGSIGELYKSKSKEDLTPEGFAARLEREAKAKAREQKKQQTIQASIALLAEQIKLGNISADQLKKIGGKK